MHLTAEAVTACPQMSPSTPINNRICPRVREKNRCSSVTSFHHRGRNRPPSTKLAPAVFVGIHFITGVFSAAFLPLHSRVYPFSLKGQIFPAIFTVDVEDEKRFFF
ncbi:hypothetical protein V8G54_005534 [Vigna mungo]|uniref:Transmembrane protein n=1 Tax=Vigna mungo TaxID=3915 RepID=A0AAQ3S5L5_VIGMU